jgi:hypothetical protein
MIPPSIEDRLTKLLAYHAKGLFSQTEFAHQLTKFVSPDNLIEVLQRLPPDLHNAVKQGIVRDFQDAADEEHLLPERSPFIELPSIAAYHCKVSSALLEPDNVDDAGLAAVVCLPSFRPEWAVRVVGSEKEGFALLLTQPTEGPIWPTASAPVRVSRKTTQIPALLATTLCDVWRKMLSRVRHGRRETMRCDGVTYHFCVSIDMAGWVWSPSPDTAPGRLAQAGHSLRELTLADEATRQGRIDHLLRQLFWFQGLG